MEAKLPISVERVKQLSICALSHDSFKSKLAAYTRRKTALNKEQLSNVVQYYTTHWYKRKYTFQ